MKTSNGIEFTNPTHIRFVEKVKRFCAKHKIDVDFEDKIVEGGASPPDGLFIVGLFTPPTDEKRIRIQASTQFGHDVAIYALAHELCHAKRYLENPIKFMKCYKDAEIKCKEEILTDRRALRMLRKEKVEVCFEELELAHGRLVKRCRDCLAFLRLFKKKKSKRTDKPLGV